MDASRPWLFYWTMAGLSFLGEDVSSFRDRLIETVRPLQNPTGGFGGGHGHLSHCACSYATVLALACVGGLEAVNRKTMWEWLGRVKQADGGFCMAEGAEEDIRGAYCAATIISLLNLPLELPPESPARKAGLERFTDRLGEWVGRCQTYEGGIGGAPTNEAHGAYAFCALACLSILDAPHVSVPKYLDVEALAAWLAARQTRSEGGFQGRQEKLVDACYSHWVGGCWDLIQAAIPGQKGKEGSGDLWNRAALIRYLLACCQNEGKKGGMQDKPSTHPDAYHTCYSIAGFSHAQNHYYYDEERPTTYDDGRLMAAFNWGAQKPTREEMKEMKIGQEDLVSFVHPVFVVPMGVVEAAREQFKDGGL
jgi:protein farnesyltransferase subunit beta